MQDNGQKSGVARSAVARLRLIGLTFVALLLGVPPAHAQNTSIFGPNVYVFTPSMSASSINTTLNTLNGNSQFSTNRYAVLFMPGTYTGVQSEVGYYESVAGLGQTPSAVSINNGYLEANQSGGNSTLTFWRSLGNMSITPPSGTVLQWGVSQGISFRRMDVNGGMELTTSSCGYGSGGFISDTEITGQLNACDQQQWYTRNSSIGSWSGGSFNMVFSGVTGAPAQSFPNPPYTTLVTTPVSREMPFLYVDGSGNYWVFSPGLRTNSSGISWSGGGMGIGTSLPISSFFIATPSSTLAQINAALSAGQNLILTPGIYQYSGSINVVNANTVVLGLGYPTLVPQTGTAAITVADVDGVQVAGVLIDAGPVNSPVLFQVGVAGGSRVSHASNPTSLNDVFFRIGGATAGTATTSLEIDSDNVILDNIWAWRADHGNANTVGWTVNVADHGLVVNGDDVTALGLAAEHYEQNQVVWNGQGGETIFYQSELPYDVPSQSAWMNGGVDGYSSYSVSGSVTSHVAYGLGVYSLFNQGVNIVETSAITVPNVAGVQIIDAMTWFIGDSGSITHVVNNTGAAVNSGSKTSYLSSFGGQPPPTSCTSICINAGGPAVSPFVADEDFTGGATTSHANTINTSNVTNPAPAAVYQTGRDTSAVGPGTTFSYTIGGFTAGTDYLVRLHFCETFFTAAGKRTFNVSINGTQVLTNFDIFATAGGQNIANIQQFTEPANSNGQFVILFTSEVNNALISGIEIDSATTCSTPTAPSGLTATATSSSQINLSWTASSSSCPVTYNVFRGTTSGFTPSSSNQIASGVITTTYSDMGLVGSTTYYYVVEATNSGGTSAASNQASATTLCSLPTAPSGLSATATSSSQINLSWTASSSSCGVTYNVFGSTTSGFTPSTSNEITSGVTATTYSNTGLAASTTYYYLVEGTNSAGTSAASSQASATTSSASTGSCTSLCINAGGPAVSPFVADEDFTGGATTNHANTINTSKVTNPAPSAVYQTGRDTSAVGPGTTFTYTIGGFTANSSHTVRLHFCETFWTAAGKRTFNVSINGTQVLTNFDIFATAGGQNIANIQQFTENANASGQYVILFTSEVNNALISGIEID